MCTILRAICLCLYSGLWISLLLVRDLFAQSVGLEPVLMDLASPVYVTHAGDGSQRLFVLERAGRILVLQPGGTVPSVFLDIQSRVLSGGERGLLGLAFHPDYARNRRFFVNYTRDPDGTTVIAEYRASMANPDLADIQEIVLLSIAQPFSNHNGGMLVFGPDGFLYIATGDGGSGNDPDNRSQNPNDLLGKILRLNIDQSQSESVLYSSPPGNPFFGEVSGRDEVFALGLRNPWRFSFDRATYELYAGDVGQGEREEVDIVTIGGNYGWRVFEGSLCTDLGPDACVADNFTAPLVEYDHMQGRCSITGGYVYRGNALTLPTGTYVYADFCTGEIFLYENGEQTVVLDTDLLLASFGEDEAGEMYVVGLGGTIARLVNTEQEGEGVAIVAQQEVPQAGQEVSGIDLVAGWAVATQVGVLIAQVELFIDGISRGTVPCCSERADVRAALPQFPALNTLRSGWGLLFNWNVLVAGEHTLRVEIQTSSGVVFSTPLRTVMVVKPGGFEFLSAFDVSDATTRRDGDDIVIEGLVVRDKSSGDQKTIDLRLRWFENTQRLGVIESSE